MEKKGIKIRNIKNGIVIDHIPAGKAFEVLRILGIDESFQETVTVAINVPSGAFGRKDLLKVENRDLQSDEVNKIAVIAPHATINKIKNYKVESKEEVVVPKIVVGVLKCPNPACVTNAGREPIKSVFEVLKTEPLLLKCRYCERTIT
ncbi:MAG: aspartate carbamoyltransferase regulatory subunit [Candidatus Altiarchaeota archaeon]